MPSFHSSPLRHIPPDHAGDQVEAIQAWPVRVLMEKLPFGASHLYNDRFSHSTQEKASLAFYHKRHMLRLIPIIPDFSTKHSRPCTIWFSVLGMSRWVVINPLKHYYHLVLSFKSKSISNFNTQMTKWQRPKLQRKMGVHRVSVKQAYNPFTASEANKSFQLIFGRYRSLSCYGSQSSACIQLYQTTLFSGASSLNLLRRAGPESLSHYAQYIEMRARWRQLIYLHLSGKRCTSRTNHFTPLERIHQNRLWQIMTFRSYECAPQKTKVVTSLVLLDKR